MKTKHIIEHILNWLIIVTICVTLFKVSNRVDIGAPFVAYCIIILIAVMFVCFVITEIKLLKLHILSCQLNKIIEDLNGNHLSIGINTEQINKITSILERCRKRGIK